MMELRMPSIGGTDREQLAQIRSYLYQLIPQLQWAINNATVPSSYIAPQAQRSTAVASTSFDTETAFDALKPLIIKSADIVEAFYEEINTRLEGTYTAKSDFGTFTEQTSQSISETSTDIEQAFTDIQKIATDIATLNFTLAEVNAHIRSGLLYYDGGVPVYGLEIGQRNTIDGEEVFNKYARFTSDRLSFYDQNDTEVAYISDYKLHITHTEITGSLKLGAFLIDTAGGLTIKWVGGDS